VAPLALVFLAGWGLWMVRARIPLFAASVEARLVRERAVYPIQSSVDGRVIAVHVSLEQPVEAGALLIELDPTERQLALDEERARLGALEAEIEAARTAVTALETALEESHASATAEGREAEVELEVRTLSRTFADEEAQRLTQLETTGDVSKLTASRSRTEAEKARVAIRAQEATLARLEQDARRDERDRLAELAERRRELAEREGQRSVHAASIARLEHELAARRLCAPSAGTVAELARLAPGASSMPASRSAPWSPTAGSPSRPTSSRPRPWGACASARAPSSRWRASRRRSSAGCRSRSSASRARRATAASASSSRWRRRRVHACRSSTVSPGAVRIEVERTSPAELVLRAVGGALGLSRAKSDG
jgi:membrane fusion protein (multidrug efflux system)